jgi:hypothetical protein
MSVETLSTESQIERALEKEGRTLQRQVLLKKLWKLRRHKSERSNSSQESKRSQRPARR